MDLLVSQSAFETFIALSNVSVPTSYSVIDLDIGVDSDDVYFHTLCEIIVWKNPGHQTS